MLTYMQQQALHFGKADLKTDFSFMWLESYGVIIQRKSVSSGTIQCNLFGTWFLHVLLSLKRKSNSFEWCHHLNEISSVVVGI